jgi:hypothetical protein
MLARVLSAAVNGIEAFPVEVEVNSGWGDIIIVITMLFRLFIRSMSRGAAARSPLANNPLCH